MVTLLEMCVTPNCREKCHSVWGWGLCSRKFCSMSAKIFLIKDSLNSFYKVLSAQGKNPKVLLFQTFQNNLQILSYFTLDCSLTNLSGQTQNALLWSQVVSQWISFLPLKKCFYSSAVEGVFILNLWYVLLSEAAKLCQLHVQIQTTSFLVFCRNRILRELKSMFVLFLNFSNKCSSIERGCCQRPNFFCPRSDFSVFVPDLS